MVLLAVVCALITAALIAVVSLWQRRARPLDGLEHAKSLYAAFVADVDRREAAGQVDGELAGEERVEAARALLKAEAGITAPPVSRPKLVAIVTFLAAAVTFGLYVFLLGHPAIPDQPYGPRLAQWADAAQRDPDSISPDALSAVLRHRAAGHANDPAYWLLLGRIDVMAGHYYDGAKDFERAQKLAPQAFTAWSELGEALTFVSSGVITHDAQGAFTRALAIDPTDPRAHYYLGKMNLDAGRYDAARQDFTVALSQLAQNDSRRAAISTQLQAVDTAQTAAVASRARIAGMVASLAAQLKASPDNPDGWARLLRSYDVLGDPAGKAKAEADMQAAYHDRPQVASAILAKSQAAVGAENTGGE